MDQLKLNFYALSFFLLIVGQCPAGRAYSPVRGNVYVMLGPYISQTIVDNSQFSASPDQGGLGITLLGDVNERGSLQVNTLFFNKLYYRTQGAEFLAEKASLVHVSMGYRHWWCAYFATSLALYTSYPMADVEVVHSDLAPGSGLTTTARENSETGLDAGISLQLARSGRYGLMADGLYSYSLTKKSEESSSQYGFMLSIRYFLQGSDPKEDRQ